MSKGSFRCLVEVNASLEVGRFGADARVSKMPTQPPRTISASSARREHHWHVGQKNLIMLKVEKSMQDRVMRLRDEQFIISSHHVGSTSAM